MLVNNDIKVIKKQSKEEGMVNGTKFSSLFQNYCIYLQTLQREHLGCNLDGLCHFILALPGHPIYVFFFRCMVQSLVMQFKKITERFYHKPDFKC